MEPDFNQGIDEGDIDDVLYNDFQKSKLNSQDYEYTIQYRINQKMPFLALILNYYHGYIKTPIQIMGSDIYCKDKIVYRPYYNERIKDLSKRMQYVSFTLFKCLNATKAESGYEFARNGIDQTNYKAWFLYSKNEYQPINDLPDDDAVEPDFRSWVQNPNEVVTTLTDYQLYPPFEGTWTDEFNPKWDPKVPIDFDFGYKEFLLVYEDKNGTKKKALLRNSLGFGAPVFEISKRDADYDKPSTEEVSKFQAIAWKSKDMESVISEIGKPDIKLPPLLFNDVMKEQGHVCDIINQICYTELSPRVVVIFREYEDGLITVQYAGKQKEDLN